MKFLFSADNPKKFDNILFILKGNLSNFTP